MGINNYVPSREDVAGWIKMTDSNSDGRVSLDEYEELVIRSLRNAGINVD